MCIYLGDNDGLTYRSQEHVIPAGLGGQLELPKGYVSDQFNNRISGLELRFMRNSLVSLPRVIFGPGKRGSLLLTDASISQIGLIEDPAEPERIGLGYIKLGKVYEIPHLVIDTDSKLVVFNMDASVKDSSEALQNFQYALINADDPKTRRHTVINNSIPLNKVLLGVKHQKNGKNEIYLYRHSANPFESSVVQLNEIGSKFHFPNPSEQAAYLPKLSGTIDFHPDYLRVYSKIAFNFLASLKGKEFVSNGVFDGIRNWIVNGGTNEFARLNQEQGNPFTTMGIELPQDAHVIYIGEDGSHIFSQVYLYGAPGVSIILPGQLAERCGTHALICDWKNRKEYSLPEYLKTIRQ